MFTSLYPEYHKVLYYQDFLSNEIPFLPEILQNNGYKTFFYIPNKDDSIPIDKVYNRGITKIISSGRNDQDNTISYLNDALDSFLANAKYGIKTFSFLHTYYVHSPYVIDDREKIYTKDDFDNIPLSLEKILNRPFTENEYQALLKDVKSPSPNGVGIWHFVDKNFYDRLKNAENLKEAEKIFRNEGGKQFWYAYYMMKRYFEDVDRNDPKQVEYLKALYDQKIHEFDEWVGNKLIPFLDNPAIKNNTMIVITSDHGEEFMERGNFGHRTLYNTNLKTPLFIYIPGINNKTIYEPVQSVDITPTILDTIGISKNNFNFQGESLISLIQKNTKLNRLLFSYTVNDSMETIVKDNWKLFLKKLNNDFVPYELYDLKSDPNEKKNVLIYNMKIVNEIMKESEEYKKTQINY